LSDGYDIAVIGAGIAGASIAAELAPHARLLIAEAEDTPGYHTTGRSAAFFHEFYGGSGVAPLTMASGPRLRELGVLSPRGSLYIARTEDAEEIERYVDRFAGGGVGIERLGRAGLERHLSGLRPEWTLALYEPACADIDVAALHQHYLAVAKRAGAELRVSARLEAAEREGDGWRLSFGGAGPSAGEARACVIVNAAGAWADEIAALAAVRPLGIAPLRRTIAQLRTDPEPPRDLPLVLDINSQFYFKPEHGRLWLSPEEETPSPPCDAAPEEIDVAIAIDRFEKVVDWRIEAVERKWAGLRTFAPDRLPVYGFDPARGGFFWFAGQGGFGIQTAPAAARLAAQLLLGMASDEMTAALEPGRYSPARFD
jgi:D-arginine dehydrogenase